MLLKIENQQKYQTNLMASAAFLKSKMIHQKGCYGNEIE